MTSNEYLQQMNKYSNIELNELNSAGVLFQRDFLIDKKKLAQISYEISISILLPLKS